MATIPDKLDHWRNNDVPRCWPAEEQRTYLHPPRLCAASQLCHLDETTCFKKKKKKKEFKQTLLRSTCSTHSLTFRQADGSVVVQVVSEVRCSEALLVGAEASRRGGGEYNRPTFGWRDVDAHQTVLPPPVADPCLQNVGKKSKINFTKSKDNYIYSNKFSAFFYIKGQNL